MAKRHLTKVLLHIHNFSHNITPLSIQKVLFARNAATLAVDANYHEDPSLASAKPFSEMPALPMLPLIGSAWQYFPLVGRYSIDKMHIAAIEKQKIYGDVLHERVGNMNIVISFRPEDMETVMKHEGKYPNRGEFSTLKAYRESRKQWYTSTGLMILQGKEWHDLRSKVQPHLMKPKAVQAYLEPMQDVARDLISRINYIKDRSGEVSDLLPELYKWALESVAVVGLDTRLGCLANDLSHDSDGQRMIDAVQTKFKCMMKLEAMTGNIPYWKFFPTPTWKRFVRAADVFSEISYKYINQALDALKNNAEGKELTLLQAMLSTKGFDLSRAMVTVADMLMAGIDTTSHAVGYLLYHLARNPEKQELLHQEVTKILPTKSDKISQSSFNELRYLKACIKESMRLDPVVGGLGRTINHDVPIAGYRVPAGSMIFIGTQIMSRSEKYFKDAQKFVPERWMDKEVKPNPYASLPFSFGTRSCVGRRLAELEIICLATEIVKNFRVEYHHEDIGTVTRFVHTPDRPLRFNFIER